MSSKPNSESTQNADNSPYNRFTIPTIGQLVEITVSAFKGEMGRVTKVKENNEEMTIVLIDSGISIPITISSDHISCIDS